MSACGRGGETEFQTEVSATKRRKTSGDPYFVFQNARMEAAKQIAPQSDRTPSGSLTQAAREKIINEAKAA